MIYMELLVKFYFHYLTFCVKVHDASRTHDLQAHVLAVFQLDISSPLILQLFEIIMNKFGVVHYII